VVVAGFLLAVLLNAGIVLQTSGLSVSAMLAINGVILIFAAVGEVATQYHLVHERIEPRLQPDSTEINIPSFQEVNPNQDQNADPILPEKEKSE
jgi:hypothetical protein